MQAEIAIEEADVIVFVVNGREGITKEDEYVARLLQKSRKPIILVVNKIDDNQFRDYIYEFYALGVGDPIPVSGSHGIGIGDLLDQIINQLEQNKRGIYGGAIGYLDFTGNMDLCIGIRLAYKRNNEISICSGAGIVYDSVPENEYQECLNKAGAVVEAIKMADGGIDYDSTH
jgi:predicted GTPase